MLTLPVNELSAVSPPRILETDATMNAHWLAYDLGACATRLSDGRTLLTHDQATAEVRKRLIGSLASIEQVTTV